jgi:hypothetical protein
MWMGVLVWVWVCGRVGLDVIFSGEVMVTVLLAVGRSAVIVLV